MCFGGGGGAQTANTVSEFKPPAWLQPAWQQTVTTAAQLASQPYQPFDGMRVAPINGYQTQGLNFLEDRALNGAPDLNAARGNVMDTANGAYLMAGPMAAIDPGVNGYAGANPYVDAMIAANAADMANAWKVGGAAQIDAMANDSNGWGGGGWRGMQDAGIANLEKQVGQMANQVRFGDYTTQQGLAESALNRGMQAQQINAQSAQSAWDAERNRQMQAAGLAGNLSADDWKAGQALTGVGDAYQQYVQALLSSQYQSWLDAQNYPYHQLDVLRNATSAASGGFGQSSGVQTSTLPAMSPMTGLFAGGALAYGLTH